MPAGEGEVGRSWVGSGGALGEATGELEADLRRHRTGERPGRFERTITGGAVGVAEPPRDGSGVARCRPDLPHGGRLTWDGTYTELSPLSGPSYSIHAPSGSGFVVGAAREPGADIYPADEVSAHLYLSADGVRWADVLQYRRLNANENARLDVYWELPSGELVLRLENVEAAGPAGRGYQLLRPVRR